MKLDSLIKFSCFWSLNIFSLRRFTKASFKTIVRTLINFWTRVQCLLPSAIKALYNTSCVILILRMAPRGFSGSSVSKLGLVRSMVLLVVVVALVVLMTGSFMDQQNSKVCVEQVQKDGSEVDGVLRRDLRQPLLNQSSADPTPSLPPWDYNWDL